VREKVREDREKISNSNKNKNIMETLKIAKDNKNSVKILKTSLYRGKIVIVICYRVKV
jgi:hypothetical protein